MLLRVIGELLWSVPLIALSVLSTLSLWKIYRKRSETSSIILGMAVGIACAVALSLLSGPMVSGVVIPLLPLMATIGATTGLLYHSADRGGSRKRRHIYVWIFVVGLMWMGFFFARNYVAAKEEFRLVVIKQSARPGPVNWDNSVSYLDLADADRAKVEGLLGTAAGTLKPIFSIGRGKSPQAAAILVMSQDVSRHVQLRMPDAGTVVFMQDREGAWKEDAGGAHFGKKSLALEPTPGSNFTRIEIGGPFGTQSSEIGISHQ